MDKQLKLGVIGLGNRGVSLLKYCFLAREDVCVAAVCDTYEDRRVQAREMVEQAGFPSPVCTGDYR